MWHRELVEESPIRAEAVEALLFDLGGVVIDIDFGRCAASWARSAGREAADLMARLAMYDAYERHERGSLDTAGYFASVRRTMAFDLTDAQLLAGWNDIYLGVVDGIESLLADVAARFPLYAFTNSNPAHQAVWTERFAEVLAPFETIFVSSEIGHRKPEPAAFEHIAATIDVALPNILFFDDSAENVEGARRLGVQTVHVTSPDSVRAAIAALASEQGP